MSRNNTDTIHMPGMQRMASGSPPPPSYPTFEEVETMIRAHLSDHAANKPHDKAPTLPERPCEHHKAANRWILWAFAGIAGAMVIGSTFLGSQVKGAVDAAKEASAAVQAMSWKQAKSDSDMEYLKVTMREIREDLRGKK